MKCSCPNACILTRKQHDNLSLEEQKARDMRFRLAELERMKRRVPDSKVTLTRLGDLKIHDLVALADASNLTVSIKFVPRASAFESASDKVKEHFNCGAECPVCYTPRKRRPSRAADRKR